MRRTLLPFLVILTLVVSCSSEEETTSNHIPLPPPSKVVDLHSPTVDSIVGRMTIKEKIWQLIWSDATTFNTKISKKLKDIPTFGGAIPPANPKLQEEFEDLLDSLQTPIPLVFAVQRLDFPLQQEKTKFNLEGTTNTTDTSYLNTFYHNVTAYLTDRKIHFLLDSIDLCASFYETTHSKLLEKNIVHTAIPDTLGTITNPLYLAINQDSIIPDNDTLCGINIFTTTTDSAEHILGKVLNGYHDAILIEDPWDEKLIKNIGFIVDQLAKHTDLNIELIDYKVRKILAVKEKLGLLNLALEPTKFEHQPYEKKHRISIRSLVQKSHYKGIALVNNKKSYLPLIDWPMKKWKYINLSKPATKAFKEGIRNYADITELKKTITNVKFSSLGFNGPTIVLLNEPLTDTLGNLLMEKIENASSKNKVILVNIRYEQNLELLKNAPILMHVPGSSTEDLNFAAQAITGGNAISGQIIIKDDSTMTMQSILTKKVRLSYTVSEEVGIHRDSIKKIDKVAAESIWGGVTPGCQVFMAKEGKVIYNKAFGYHTYDHKHAVDRDDVYDLASVTKVASTTITGMHMYDKGLYKISDSLKDHLPGSLQKELGHKSRLSNTSFQQLFTHTSGLPSGLPIYQYISYIDSLIGRFDRYYCDLTDSYYCVEVAKNFYLDSAYLDTMYLAMHNIWPGEKKYKYSDANMNVLYQIFRSKLAKNQRYDQYVESNFYQKLKLRTTCFLPLNKLNTTRHRIAPTEYDTYWRYQLIRGYVHDPNAALYGGVAGNAGLFSSAHDLGVVFQMLLNKGSYGRTQFIKPTTVKRFTQHQSGSHRGLGFDKPTPSSGSLVAPDCPYTAFGHTGFTGICAWVDPENELVYVFTSNRVHPSPSNKKIITYGTRKRLHQVIYDQLKYAGTYTSSTHSQEIVADSTAL